MLTTAISQFDRKHGRWAVILLILIGLIGLPVVPTEKARASSASVYQVDSGPDDRFYTFYWPYTPGPEFVTWPYLPVGTLPGGSIDLRGQFRFDGIDLNPSDEIESATLTVWAANTADVDCKKGYPCFFIWDDDANLDPHYIGGPANPVFLPNWRAGTGYKIDVTNFIQDMLSRGLDPGETSFRIEFTLFNPANRLLSITAYDGDPLRAASLAIQTP